MKNHQKDDDYSIDEDPNYQFNNIRYYQNNKTDHPKKEVYNI